MMAFIMLGLGWAFFVIFGFYIPIAIDWVVDHTSETVTGRNHRGHGIPTDWMKSSRPSGKGWTTDENKAHGLDMDTHVSHVNTQSVSSSRYLRSDDTRAVGKELLSTQVKSVLGFNGFWFHYEVIGFLLEYVNIRGINMDLVQLSPNAGWDVLWSSRFKYRSLTKLPADSEMSKYGMVLLFTDDDANFPEALVDNRTVCIDHYYKNRRPSIAHHLPIMPFVKNSVKRMQPYIMPVWAHTSYEEKMALLRNSAKEHAGRVIVAFLGIGHPKHPQQVVDAIKNYHQVHVMIIAHKIFKSNWNKAKDYNMTVTYHQNVEASEFYRLISTAHYVGFLDHHNEKHGQGHSGTSSIPNAFIGGVGVNVLLFD